MNKGKGDDGGVGNFQKEFWLDFSALGDGEFPRLCWRKSCEMMGCTLWTRSVRGQVRLKGHSVFRPGPALTAREGHHRNHAAQAAPRDANLAISRLLRALTRTVSTILRRNTF